MSLSTDDVRHVARLARLALDDETIEQLAPQLAAILAYAEQVGAVATDDVAPTSHPFPLANVWRTDVVRPGLSTAEALAPAPAPEDDRFHVPRIVGEEA